MKRTISNSQELKEAIFRLEQEGEQRKTEIKESFTVFIDDLKPYNLIKHTLQSTFAKENQSDLLKGALSVGTGILTKRLFLGGSSSTIKKVLSTALQLGVSGMIAKNAEAIKEKGADWISRFFPKNRKKKPTAPADHIKKIA
jgi:hypothetical protein